MVSALVLSLTLSAPFELGAWNADPRSFDAKQSLQESSSSATIFGVNAGIDVGYVASGAFLWQRGLAHGDARMVGVGPP